jgi:uncharacterized cupin superfamily protein
MKSTVLDGVHVWSAWQADRRIDFNGFFVEGLGGGLLIDPLPLDATRLARVRERGGAAHVLLTNADHWRGTADVAAALGCRVLAPAGDRERFGERAGKVDAWYESTADLPEGLREGIDVVLLRGGKSPVEAALVLRPQRAVMFGDAVRSHASGRLQLLPDDKLADKDALLTSFRPLLSRPIDAVLVADGDCTWRDGREALFAMLDTLPGQLFNKLNLDTLAFTRTARHPRAVTEAAEVSRAMTCRKLGFHVRRIMPGMLWPAYHHESAEEEVFLVRKGRMKVRTPQGTFPLVPGDLIALPASPAFAHQFINDGDEPCEFLALSNNAPGNVTVYPEGMRIMLGDRVEMYRLGDQRKDYWEDEPSVRG